LKQRKSRRLEKKIIGKKITFAEAARAESDQKKETRANGGVLINPQTQGYSF
jgi:peptidyl-prolyl cis-trans isomerase SurA